MLSTVRLTWWIIETVDGAEKKKKKKKRDRDAERKRHTEAAIKTSEHMMNVHDQIIAVLHKQFKKLVITARTQWK